MLDIWGMQSASLLQSFPSPDSVLSMGKTELNCVYLYKNELFEIGLFWHLNCVHMLNWMA